MKFLFIIFLFGCGVIQDYKPEMYIIKMVETPAGSFHTDMAVTLTDTLIVFYISKDGKYQLNKQIKVSNPQYHSNWVEFKNETMVIKYSSEYRKILIRPIQRNSRTYNPYYIEYFLNFKVTF